MREVISIHVGQAGVQISECCWQLYCLEHGIYPDGTKTPFFDSDSMVTSFFKETAGTGRYVPRSVLVDLEPTVVDQVRKGFYQNLFDHDDLLTGNEGTYNNFHRGYTVGRNNIDDVIDRIKKQSECCNGLQGFIFFHSVGGGTGSGFTPLIMEHLSQEFGNKSKIQFAIYPTPNVSTSVLEPYNAVFATHYTMDLSDCTFMLENEAIYGLFKKRLSKLPFQGHTNLNNVISQAVSSVTASHRFGGSLNVYLAELAANIVPFPRMHFPVISYAANDTPGEDSIHEATMKCLDTSNQMVTCYPQIEKYLAICMLYRGDVIPEDVNRTISALKTQKKIQFVNWSPTGFKVGINYRRPIPVTTLKADMAGKTRSLCMLSNTTAITEAWSRLLEMFDLMYAKRAFVHHYFGEQMDESDFIEARENVFDLMTEYNKYSLETIQGEDDSDDE